MKVRIVLILLVVTALLAVGIYVYERNNRDLSSLEPLSSAHIVLTKEGYVPRDVVLTVGAVVEFSATTGRPHWPASNLHPQHTIYPAFDPARPLGPDESWSFTFDTAGVWQYHDHLRSYYVGTITVVE